MKIAVLIEGQTEGVFLPHLRRFLATRLAGRMPRLDPVPYDGRIPRGEGDPWLVRRRVHVGAVTRSG